MLDKRELKWYTEYIKNREAAKMKRLNVEQLRAKAEKYVEQYNVVTIRTQTVPFALGEIKHCSNVWVDGDKTDEELDGISATDIKSWMIKAHSSEYTNESGCYWGNYQAIVCGNSYSWGDDDGEVIIDDAIIADIIF